MILLKSTYLVDADTLATHLAAHLQWVNAGYDRGEFLASGLRDGGIGAVILATALDAEGARAVLATDPFVQHGIAEYDVIEFEAARVAEGIGLG